MRYALNAPESDRVARLKGGRIEIARGVYRSVEVGGVSGLH